MFAVSDDAETVWVDTLVLTAVETARVTAIVLAEVDMLVETAATPALVVAAPACKLATDARAVTRLDCVAVMEEVNNGSLEIIVTTLELAVLREACMAAVPVEYSVLMLDAELLTLRMVASLVVSVV
jgi:hypothetical protein